MPMQPSRWRRPGGRCFPACAFASSVPRPWSWPVLLVADVLQPLGVLAVELLLHRDMAHRRGRRGAMPMLLARREPNHVAGPDLLDRPALALHAAAARGHDQRLAEWVRVPRRARARLEGDQGASDTSRVRRGEERIAAPRTGKPLSRSLAGWLRACALDVHRLSPPLPGRENAV